jgi:hypothetical protein
VAIISEDTGLSLAHILKVDDSANGLYSIQLNGNVYPARSTPSDIVYVATEKVGVVVIGSSGEFAIIGKIAEAT